MGPLSIALGLAQFAPSLMRYLGAGEASAVVAERAVALAQSVTGASTGAQAVEQLQASAELADKYRLAVLAADQELELACLTDRQSARSRDVELIRAGRPNTRADVMVVGAVAGLIACLVCLIWFRQGLPGEAVGIISTVAGIFGACLRDAFQFEFGSSRGSREKDTVISNMTRSL